VFNEAPDNDLFPEQNLTHDENLLLHVLRHWIWQLLYTLSIRVQRTTSLRF
jgi:hypothetical protein